MCCISCSLGVSLTGKANAVTLLFADKLSAITTDSQVKSEIRIRTWWNDRSDLSLDFGTKAKTGSGSDDGASVAETKVKSASNSCMREERGDEQQGAGLHV